MAKIIFFEKNGCINNNKQKELLRLAGHSITAVDLLRHTWDYDQLVDFFQGLPVPTWFNPMAPDIRDGVIDPKALTEAEALQLLLHKPLLIRRPLLQIGASKIVGFDIDTLSELIEIEPLSDVQHGLDLKQSDFTACPAKQSSKIKCSSTPACP